MHRTRIQNTTSGEIHPLNKAYQRTLLNQPSKARSSLRALRIFPCPFGVNWIASLQRLRPNISSLTLAFRTNRQRQLLGKANTTFTLLPLQAHIGSTTIQPSQVSTASR